MSERLPEREAEKLLGGYATGTLTPEEREALFAAALGNQSLFDALADEQALKEVLDDPASRARLLAAVGERRESALQRMMAWLRRPSVVALGAAVAAAVLLMVVVQPGKLKKEPASTVAMQEPVTPPVSAPPAAVAPARVPERQEEGRRRELQVLDAEKNAVEKDTRAVGSRPAAEPERAAAKPMERKESLGREATVAQSSPPLPPPPPVAAPVAPAGMPLAASGSAGYAPQKGGAQVDMVQKTVTTGARDLYYARRPTPVFGAFTGSPMMRSKKSVGTGGAQSAAAAVPGIRYSVQERLADGGVREIDPAAPVGVGNGLRVRFEANQEGDLTVMRRESDGKLTPWGSAHMRTGEAVYLPGDFTTMAAAGEFHFQVRFARNQAAAKQEDLKVAPQQLREQSGSAVYVVNPQGAADGGVEFEFAITAK